MTRLDDLAAHRSFLLAHRQRVLSDKTAAAQELARALWTEILETEATMRRVRR